MTFEVMLKTFSITSEGDPRYDRNETADISSIGPGDFDGNKSWFDAFAYGAKLGFTDTARGVTQMAGGEKVFLMDQSLEDQQKEL